MMTTERYPIEVLDENDDCGVMPENVETLASHVVGHRIVSASEQDVTPDWRGRTAFVLTLDNGKQVALRDTSDCCAYTEAQ